MPDPDAVHGPYKDWVTDVRSKCAVYLPPVADWDQNTQDTVNQIKERLAGVVSQVKAAKRRLLERVPD